MLKKSKNNEEHKLLLEEKGLIKKVTSRVEGQTIIPIFSDYFYTNRVVITLRDSDNRIVGFAGRAVDIDDTPKYLFTKDLPKSKILYGLKQVEMNIPKDNKPLDIYIVEGIFDALRLISVGLNAVAVLGSVITLSQVEVLETFLFRCREKHNGNVILHIFLDTDTAGIKGAFKTLRNLWQKDFLRNTYIDVIVNKNNLIADPSIKSDPDDALSLHGKEWLLYNTLDVCEFLTRLQCNFDNLS